MDYILYTTVDITNTGQYRPEPGKEAARWKEQNFQTVLQALGIRANVVFNKKPECIQIIGSNYGFKTNKPINVWKFEFSTERDDLYLLDGNQLGYLIKDFEGVPYISGLDECMEQNYDVFVTEGAAKNIIFNLK
jgi:hypothetical protein